MWHGPILLGGCVMVTWFIHFCVMFQCSRYLIVIVGNTWAWWSDHTSLTCLWLSCTRYKVHSFIHARSLLTLLINTLHLILCLVLFKFVPFLEKLAFNLHLPLFFFLFFVMNSELGLDSVKNRRCDICLWMLWSCFNTHVALSRPSASHTDVQGTL